MSNENVPRSEPVLAASSVLSTSVLASSFGLSDFRYASVSKYVYTVCSRTVETSA